MFIYSKDIKIENHKYTRIPKIDCYDDSIKMLGYLIDAKVSDVSMDINVDDEFTEKHQHFLSESKIYPKEPFVVLSRSYDILKVSIFSDNEKELRDELKQEFIKHTKSFVPEIIDIVSKYLIDKDIILIFNNYSPG